MKKILLLNTYYGSLNMGDGIICKSIEKNLPWLYENNYVYELASHTPLFYWYQKLFYKKRLSIYKNADLKFLMGSNALYSNMLRPFPTWNIHLFNTSLVKNTILLGVGSGKNSKRVNLYTKFLYRRVLSKKYIHSVRDEDTKLMIESLGFKAINTGCPTLWGLTPEFTSKIPRYKSKKVVTTLNYGQKNYVKDKIQIETLISEYDEVYFWPQNIDDLPYLGTLIDINKIKIISPNLKSYDEFLCFNDADYVGNRLHAGIFALQHGRRSIIISIDYRARNMSESYSLSVIDRNLNEDLNKMINSALDMTVRGIDFEKIDVWINQFRNDDKAI